MSKKNEQKREAWSAYLFLAPYLILFLVFIVIPVGLAIMLSFTDFDSVNFPTWVGLKNYISLFTSDAVFMQYVVPNTLKFSLIAGPLGYILSFLMAWMLAQVPKRSRTVLALVLYSPSMTSGVAMTVIWKVLFNGDQTGYLNSLLLSWGLIREPVQWLQSTEWLMPVMIVVTLWSSMGVGFLSMLAGILNINQELYEAARVDGAGRWRLMWHITLPAIRGTIVMMFILRVGGILNTGYEQIFLMRNDLNVARAEVFDTYIYMRGIRQGQYSFSAAAGMFKSVVGMILVIISDRVAKACGESGIY